MNGEFIVDRLLPHIVRDICVTRNIEFKAFSDDWVLRLRKGDATKWIVGYTFDINSAGSVQVSSDKVAAYYVLRDVGIPAVEHYLVRSRALSQFIYPSELDNTTSVVAKPLSSSSGLGVMPFVCLEDAKSYIMAQPVGDWTLSPRYEIISETRYFLLDSEVLLAYNKTQPSDNHGLPMFNLGQGAIAEIVETDSVLTQLAIASQRATGLRLCAVDIVRLADGTHKIMELNSGFMMEHFARQSDEYYQKTYDLYQKIVLKMMNQQ